MRAVRYHEGGDPSVLTLEEVERPEPGHGEVLVEVRAASVNPVDAKLRESGPSGDGKTTGSDVAGVVESVGSGVGALAEGDRIFATGLHTDRFTGGTFADYVTVPTDLIAPLPANVSFEDGAAVALAGVTAWLALVHRAGVAPGDSVFVHGGNGGVGHLAVGLADAMGATPVASARPSYHDALRGLGAETVIDYRRDDLAAAALIATDGADAILDHMPDTYFGADIEMAADGADVVIIAGGAATIEDTFAARSKDISFHMLSMSNLAAKPEEDDIAPILARIGQLVANGRLSVVIDRTVSLEDASEAHRAVMDESFLGKIVVVP